MSAELYNDWYVSAEWSDIGPSTGSQSTYQKHNVDKIYTIFHGLGWTDNAIAGMLGNMQVESGIDPACSYPKIGNSMAAIGNTYAENYPDRAYGLVQWKGRGTVDPDNNQLVGYAIRYGYEWYDGDIQMNRLTWEYQSGSKFHPKTIDGVYWTFNDYAISTENPSVLAKVWMRCYEDTYSVLSNRQANADAWYDYISGGPTPPTPDDWISGTNFSALAEAYDPDITGVPIPYTQMDCYQFVQTVWRDIDAVSSTDKLCNPVSQWGTSGTNTLWRQNVSPYPTWTFNTTSPDNQNPTPVLWWKGTISDCIAEYGEIPAGALLFHQIGEDDNPRIPNYYRGDGIGNFAHVGIYIGNSEVMQSGGRDSSSVPGGGVHRSAYDSSAWNYVAFVVYVDCTGGGPTPPPPPPPPAIKPAVMDTILAYVVNNKKDVRKNVKGKWCW